MVLSTYRRDGCVRVQEAVSSRVSAYSGQRAMPVCYSIVTGTLTSMVAGRKHISLLHAWYRSLPVIVALPCGAEPGLWNSVLIWKLPVKTFSKSVPTFTSSGFG